MEDGFDQELALEAGLKNERMKASNRTLPAVLLPAVRGSVWPEAREAGWQDEDISSGLFERIPSLDDRLRLLLKRMSD